MNMRIGLFTLVFHIALAVTVSLAAESSTPPEDLSVLVKTALENNPELKSSQARWQMFTTRAKQASSLEDPMFMFKLQNMLAREPFVFNKDPQSAKVIGISQQIPFWGKRALKEEVALYEAESYRWGVAERRLELARMVKETYYQLYSVDKSLQIVEKNLKVLDDIRTIAESKYSVGQGAQQDIYKAGLERSKMLEMQITLQQQRRSLAANLNYLLFRSEDTPVGRIGDFDLPKLELSARQLKETADDKRPQIRSLTNLVQKGEASRRLAQKEYWPDFNLSFEYMFKEAVSTEMVSDPGYNMFTLGVTFNLPFQRERRQAMTAEASSESSMSQAELHALRSSIGYAINDLLAQMERRQKLVELYTGGIIPQAEQSLESAVIGYRVNKVDFLTLLDGRMNLFTYERELYESKAEYMMRLAQLEAVVGSDLPPAAETTATVAPAVAGTPTHNHTEVRP